MDPAILSTARDAARETGALIVSSMRKVRVMHKASNNLVTQTDLNAEKAIVETIGKRFPGHDFFAEEGEYADNLNAEHLWIIDPLDGTNNFAHGIPLCCVSIAYASHGEILAGVVYDPFYDELFQAHRGGGATCNDRPIRVSDTRALGDAIVTTGFGYDRGTRMEQTFDTLREFMKENVQGVRRTGSAAIDACWVACGRFDCFFEYKIAPWDFAAASCIIREAGGHCSKADGSVLTPAADSILATNGRLHELALAVCERGKSRCGI